MKRTPRDLAIGSKYQQQLLRAEGRRNNALFEKLIEPILYCPDDDLHVPFFDRKAGTYSQWPYEQIVCDVDDDDDDDLKAILPLFQLFTNPLRFAHHDPSKVKKGVSSGSTPPSARVTNGGFQSLTFEHDGDDAASLEQQLDWFRGKPENCPFNKVHQALSQFADYRGYEVVFSGHKSLHIHIIFDTKHLDKKLAHEDKGALRHWSVDVPEFALAALHQIVWKEIAKIIQDELNIDLEFDQRVSTYYAKRRSPWGTRIMDKQNNIHGFEIGDEVTQIVVQDRILSRSSPKAVGVLFSSDKATVSLECATNSQHRPSAKPVMAEDEMCMLDELTRYLRENGWAEYPKPAMLKYHDPHNVLYFKNHAADQNPNTFIQGDYRTVLPAGVGAPPQPFPLPNNFTLDETLSVCEQRIVANNGQLVSSLTPPKGRPKKWTDTFADQATSVDQARRIQGKMLAHVPDLKGTTLIQGLPGSGKTHSLMANIQERRWDDDAERFANGRNLSFGFIVMASPSYKQAAAKRKEYLDLDTGNSCAVLLISLSELYRRAAESLKKDALDRRAIGNAGYQNFIDGVKKLHPDVFCKMIELRNAMWTRNGQTLFHPNHTVLFMTNELIRHWPNSRIAKAFLHPEFPDNYTNDDIERCCREMSFYRVIYDEVDTYDLVSLDEASLVNIARDVRNHHRKAEDKPWDESGLASQVAAYEQVMSHYPKLQFGFDECNRIIRTKYQKSKHRYSVDFKRFPFGKGPDHRNLYAKCNGKKYFCKPKNWWVSLGCPVIILTTEDLPKNVFSKINHGQNRKRCLPLMNAPHLFQECIPVIFDERARTPNKKPIPNCRSLASELLKNGTEFVIGNKLKDINIPLPTPTCSHISAKGRNDLNCKSIATIITYPACKQYDQWAILGSTFDISNPIQLAYRDIVLQDIGRNTGFRRNPVSAFQPHKVYIKQSLYRDLGYFEVGSDIPFHFYNRAA